jgi:hypothetical protein
MLDIVAHHSLAEQKLPTKIPEEPFFVTLAAA